MKKNQPLKAQTGASPNKTNTIGNEDFFAIPATPTSRLGYCLDAASRLHLPLKEFVDALNHATHIGIQQKSMHRQAQHPRAEQLCIWTTRRTELDEGFLAVQRNGVMD